MAFCVKKFGAGDKERKKSSQQEEIETLTEREEQLMKKKESLKTKIVQELLIIKENSRKNRRVALQALRRKKWYEKYLNYIDCAVKNLRGAINTMDDLIKDITDMLDQSQDMLEDLCTSVDFGEEFDEDELLAELDKILEGSLFDEDRAEERVTCPKVSSTEPPSHHAKTDEDEDEDDLEYLQRWLNEAS